ncbi:hypothetical protein Q9233_003517 [Columba guinea]|nr:hypothetical protein Q9233_003517 [Columba guinea]
MIPSRSHQYPQKGAQRSREGSGAGLAGFKRKIQRVEDSEAKINRIDCVLPSGFRDWVPKELQRVGCVELLNTVQRRVRPKLHVFGGIHEGYGIMTDGYTTYINASTCTVSFQPTNPPIIFDLPTPQGS